MSLEFEPSKPYMVYPPNEDKGGRKPDDVYRNVAQITYQTSEFWAKWAERR